MAATHGTTFVYEMKKEALQAYLKDADIAYAETDTVTVLRKRAVEYVRGLTTSEGHSSTVGNDTQVSAQQQALLCKALDAVPLVLTSNFDEVIQFLVAVDRLYDLKLVNETFFVQYLLSKVSGLVLDLLNVSIQSGQTYPQFKESVLQHTCPARTRHHCIQAYVRRFQHPHEPLASFIQSIVSSERALNMQMAENELVSIITQNMTPLAKQHRPPGPLPTTLVALRAWAVEVENELVTTREFLREHAPQGDRVSHSFERRPPRPMRAEARVASVTPFAPPVYRSIRCGNCSVFGHASGDCPSPRFSMRERMCFKCRAKGHLAFQCQGNA